MNLQEIAERLGADLVPADGLDEVLPVHISGVAGIEVAGPTEITFVSNPKYAGFARKTRAAAVLVEPGFGAVPVPTLRIADPYSAFATVLGFFDPSPVYAPGVHPTAVIAEDVKIGERAHIGAYVVISEGCELGHDATLLPHVVLYPKVTVGHRFFAHAHVVVRERTVLGDDVLLQNGAVVGSDGFGFAKASDDHWKKLPHTGRVVIGDAVEVQANTVIDRASIGETRVGRGTKIDNLVQVGHGSTVGEDTLLCAQVGLAGSTEIGNKVILAGQVGVAGHLKVGDGVIATAQSGIPADVAPGSYISGAPAVDHRTWLRNAAAMNRLPEILKKLRSLK